MPCYRCGDEGVNIEAGEHTIQVDVWANCAKCGAFLWAVELDVETGKIKSRRWRDRASRYGSREPDGLVFKGE